MDEDLEKLRNGLGDIDRAEESVARSFVNLHLAHYFASSEQRRCEVLTELENAERRGQDILASESLPGGTWRSKYPAAARAAVLAVWRTPRT